MLARTTPARRPACRDGRDMKPRAVDGRLPHTSRVDVETCEATSRQGSPCQSRRQVGMRGSATVSAG